MKRIALVCAAVLSTLGLSACADYYGGDYGYRTHYGYLGSGYTDSYYGDRYCTRGWYDRLGYYHPPTCSRYRYGY